MTPFQRAYYGPDLTPESLVRDHRITYKQARAAVAEMRAARVYRNDLYEVAINDLGSDILHLSIKRLDREPIHDWRDLQRIKNELVGPECEAVEVYPAESRLVDTANQYHLWACSNPAYRFPIGFNHGREVTNTPGGKAKQRPIDSPTSRAGTS